jgi:hypothetical protein
MIVDFFHTVKALINSDRKRKKQKSELYYFYGLAGITQGTFHGSIRPLKITTLAFPGFNVLLDVFALFSYHLRHRFLEITIPL